MAACAIESAAASGNGDSKGNGSGNEGGGGDGRGNGSAAPAGCVISVDGAYAARLTRSGASWYPERWTLDGPEPYAVPLPGNQPEEPGTEVLPMADGRVLIHRLSGGRHAFSLLYPTGPGTGEVPLGAVECPEPGTELRLLPPAPGGQRAYALAVGPLSTAVWLVAGGSFGPEHLAEVPGRCSGGVWLGGGERLLALDRQARGRTKTVVVDLRRGGELSPLLQIAEDSDDRLLLADADSGLLLVRSDAPSPGRERLGWGVLGSALPVRFPECLQPAGCTVTPFAIQPGLVLTPESCWVALRIDGASGSWVGVWRPAERHLHQFPAPEGWLTGSGRWTGDGVLHLPYATGAVPCGVARFEVPARAGTGTGTGTGAGVGDAGPGDPGPGSAGPRGAGPGTAGPATAGSAYAGPGGAGPRYAGPAAAGPEYAGPAAAGPGDGGSGDAGRRDTGPGAAGPGDADRTAGVSGDAPWGWSSVTGPPDHPAVPRPVPLQQAPLTGRAMANAFTGRRLAQAGMAQAGAAQPGTARGVGRGPGEVPPHPPGEPDPPDDRPGPGAGSTPAPGGDALRVERVSDRAPAALRPRWVAVGSVPSPGPSK